MSPLRRPAVAHVRTESPHEAQPLEEHLRNVSTLCGRFACKIGSQGAGNLIGLLHDFGKYAEEFQNYILSANGLIEQDGEAYSGAQLEKGKVDHSTAGAQRVWRYFVRNRNNVLYAQILALCIASHHSGLIDCIDPEGKQIFLKRMMKNDEESHLEACLQCSESNIEQKVTEYIHPDVIRELHKAIIGIHQRVHALLPENPSEQDKADNINSAYMQKGFLVRFLLSCLLDADRIDSAAFDDPTYKNLRAQLPRQPWQKLAQRLEDHLSGLDIKHKIDDLRRNISEHCLQRADAPKGLFTLTVPTGGGKTLASLRFALRHAHKHQLDRVFYIIPYTSIIDQNARVVRTILEAGEEAGSIVLEHHSNILPEKETWRNKLLAENWEAPVVFTTMVQFLETLFGSGTRHTRRMHNLAKSVIIFDEIQTLPVHCARLFCNALNFLQESCGSSVVLCTATQPSLDKLPLPQQGCLRLEPEREIIPDVASLFTALKRVDYFNHSTHPMTLEEITSLALEELHLTGSCLVICNTKRWAEAVHAQCSKHWQGAIHYLSTHLCPAHRLDTVDAIQEELNAKKPVLCISTQVIECGIDISFASVIRFAAGLDSILQAGGRANRNGELSQGRVHIVTVRAEEEKLHFLQDIEAGRSVYLRLAGQLQAHTKEASTADLGRPELVADYFKHYFYIRQDVMSYAVRNTARNDTLCNMLGKNRLVPRSKGAPEFLLCQSFASAASAFQAVQSPTVAVLVPYKDGTQIIADLCSTSLFSHKRALLRTAQRYTVNLFPNVLKKLEAQKALHNIQGSGILSLYENYYSLERGVLTYPQGQMTNAVF